jgi:hypothetical protein
MEKGQTYLLEQLIENKYNSFEKWLPPTSRVGDHQSPLLDHA